MTEVVAVAALLLSLAMLLAGRAWSWLYAAQCVALAGSAGLAAGYDTAYGSGPIAAGVLLLVQAVVVPRLLRGYPHRATPLPAVGIGVVLTGIAVAAPLPAGFAVPLAMVLLGLLAAAASAETRHGVLLLLNGAGGAACILPTGWLPVAALSGVAAWVAVGGVPRLSALR